MYGDYHDLSDLDVLLNCIPIVNVEKGSVNLSADEPIKKIATEKVVDVQEKKDSPITQSVKAGKSFLYTSTSSYSLLPKPSAAAASIVCVPCRDSTRSTK